MTSQPRGGPATTECPAFRRRGRIVFTLVAVLVLIGLAPMTVMAWKLIDVNREALTTSQQEYQLLLASAIAHEVDIHVDGLRSQLLRVAQTLGGAIPRDSSQTAEVKATLADVVDERMPYLRFAYFLQEGVRSIPAGELPENLEPLFDSGLRESASILVQSVRSRSDQAILSDPILLETRPWRAVVVISAPVVSGGKFRGVLSALVDLQSVWGSVIARNPSGHVVFALDDRGHVFASNNPARVRPGADVGNSELVRRFLSSVSRARETLPFTELEDGEERRYIGSYEVTAQGWGIFVQARLSEVYLPVQDMIDSTTSWALVVLVLAVIAAIIFARTLSNPIKHLASASRSFAKGDFSTRAAVRSGNEIGELAYTFNTMADEIEDHIRRLKKAAQENAELFMSTIRAMAQAIDAKDPYTRGHSGRVNRYSLVLARQVGLSERQIHEIHVSSLMHDVGKIGINDAILQKPGKLTSAEFEVMKTHTTLGAAILAPIRQMKRIIPGLRWHHERWMGGGYPDGLEGESIPLMARIIAVADAFDAMTTHRPYQKAMTFDQAVARLNELKGSAFDARIVEAFNAVYREGLIHAASAEEREHAPQTPLAGASA